jgi:flagellar biosynthesis/type III secretory pathway protein FliH
LGKIVKSARIVGDHYVLTVPEVEVEEPRDSHGELDDRFASPDGLPTFASDAEPPQALDVTPEPIRVPKIDWEAVRNDARGVIDRASKGGEAILNDAAVRARALLAQAQAQSESIAEAAKSAGRDEGLAAGRAEIEADLAESVASLEGVVAEARADRQKIIEGAETEIVKLAMTIAERIVHEQITVDPKVVVDNVRQALTRLVGREVVTLRVNPADLDLIRSHRDGIAGSNDVEHLRVVEDARVDRGGVIVETDAGTIDAKISTQIREARRTLLAEPSIFSPAQAS